jgi:hypothetical protein
MILRRGKIPGTIVTDYELGSQREYMINHYGGRVVAVGVSDSDIDNLISNNLDNIIKRINSHLDNVIERISSHYGDV